MDSINKYDYIFKLILVGDSGVGKSSLLLRFAENEFIGSHITTIGIDFKIVDLPIDSKLVKLQIWDTAGQERFRSLAINYYRGSHAIVLVYDVSDSSSFTNLTKWIETIDRYAPEHSIKILVGSKVDLRPHRETEVAKAQNFAQLHNMSYFEVSSRTGCGIDPCFHSVVKECMEKQPTVLEKMKKEQLQFEPHPKSSSCCLLS